MGPFLDKHTYYGFLWPTQLEEREYILSRAKRRKSNQCSTFKPSNNVLRSHLRPHELRNLRKGSKFHRKGKKHRKVLLRRNITYRKIRRMCRRRFQPNILVRRRKIRMVIIYKVLARYITSRGHSYSEIGYYLTRQQAVSTAHEWWSKRSTLCSADKVIVQELTVGPQNAGIRVIDWVNESQLEGLRDSF